ncbi:MAG: hypothetical protein EOM59_00010 [Clostridia bacterium]|nr:hypothetical protein [Clostridia bacterium]
MSFFAILDERYKILEVKWSDPVYLVTMDTPDFCELVIEEERPLLKDELNKEPSLQTFLEHPFSFVDYDTKVHLFVNRVSEKIFVFGCERVTSMSKEVLEIAKRFILSVKEQYIQDQFSTNASVKFQFEKMQQLNNELVDTRRLLEKTNIQL